METYIHAYYMHTYIHIHKHAYIHTHIHTWMIQNRYMRAIAITATHEHLPSTFPMCRCDRYKIKKNGINTEIHIIYTNQINTDAPV